MGLQGQVQQEACYRGEEELRSWFCSCSPVWLIISLNYLFSLYILNMCYPPALNRQIRKKIKHNFSRGNRGGIILCHLAPESFTSCWPKVLGSDDTKLNSGLNSQHQAPLITWLILSIWRRVASRQVSGCSWVTQPKPMTIQIHVRQHTVWTPQQRVFIMCTYCSCCTRCIWYIWMCFTK